MQKKPLFEAGPVLGKKGTAFSKYQHEVETDYIYKAGELSIEEFILEKTNKILENSSLCNSEEMTNYINILNKKSMKDELRLSLLSKMANSINNSWDESKANEGVTKLKAPVAKYQRSS